MGPSELVLPAQPPGRGALVDSRVEDVNSDKSTVTIPPKDEKAIKVMSSHSTLNLVVNKALSRK
jgi:hypothetical protein